MTSPVPTSPAPATPTSSLSEQSEATPQSESVAACLEIEHGAIFGYGIVAAYADVSRREAIAAAQSAHRAYRDALRQTLLDAHRDPPIAAPGYAMPIPVSDPVSAIQLALRVEEDCATGWLALLERSETEHIAQFSADTLAETAIRAARWRGILALSPATVPFPGRAV